MHGRKVIKSKWKIDPKDNIRLKEDCGFPEELLSKIQCNECIALGLKNLDCKFRIDALLMYPLWKISSRFRLYFYINLSDRIVGRAFIACLR